MSIEILAMKNSDLERVIEVQKETFTSDLLEELVVFNNRFQRFGEHFLVAKVNGKIIGYAICFPWRLGEIPENNKKFPETLSGPDSFYLHDICLLKEARGLGIAGMMLNCICENAIARGYREMSLVSVEQSGDYWDKNGFETREISDLLREKLSSSYGQKARLMSKKLAL